jgi:hypothetical protein
VRLRQLALVARQLEAVVDEFCSQLGVEVAYRDPAVGYFGLQNALMAVGDQFIEVVSPVRDDTTAGRYLARRAGDGGYMVLLQVADLASAKAHATEAGVRFVWDGEGPGIKGAHLHPKDIGGAIVSFDQADPADSWGWAGSEWRAQVRTDTVRDIAAAELQSPDPRALARRWSEVLGLDLLDGPDGVPIIRLDGAALRFVPDTDGRGEGLSAIDVTAIDRSRIGEVIPIGGVKFQLV